MSYDDVRRGNRDRPTHPLVVAVNKDILGSQARTDWTDSFSPTTAIFHEAQVKLRKVEWGESTDLFRQSKVPRWSSPPISFQRPLF
jgi:hypothetical protein